MPALKFHAVARDLCKRVVRTKVTPNRVAGREVGESAPLGLCSIEVRAIGQLGRSQRRLIEQNAGQLAVAVGLALRSFEDL